MAQIVTITNPLTGQPAQVDQLEHTAQQIDDSIGRALPGGGIDTLLAGKAPAGYGLGTTPKNITDWNTANVCGWYTCDSGAANSPDSNFGWFGLTYTTGNPEIFIQDVFTLENVNKYYHRRRLYYPGTGNGTPWEWVDPPLYEGVEYRTTERYMGKPVYVKLVDFGALPNATAKAVNFSIKNNAQLLECKGFVSGGGVLPYSYPGSSVGTANVFTNRSSGNFGVIVITDKDLSGRSAYFILKYTKTTD